MRMTITREGAGYLLYESVLIRVEPERRLSLLDPQRPRGDSCLTMCSCCKRALLEPSGWLEVADISARLRLFEKPKVPHLRYDLCPDCADAMQGGADNGNAA
jgi:hypothetical protein